MKWFNFHVTYEDQLNALVNAHVKRGYKIDRIYRGQEATSKVFLMFVQDLPDDQWQAKFEIAEAQARAAQAARDARRAEDQQRHEAKELAKALRAPARPVGAEDDVRKVALKAGHMLAKEAGRPKRLPPLPPLSPTPKKA